MISGAPSEVKDGTTEVTVTASVSSPSQSATATITFPAIGKGTLAAPTGLALKANSQTSTGFTITWTAVSNAAGYTASAMRADGTGTAVAGTVSTPSTGPEAAFTGLTANTAYKVTVTATGDANYANSPASAGFDASTVANRVPTVANRAPTVANAIPDQTAKVDKAFEYVFPANAFSDGDSDSLTYTATKSDDSALPTWLTFTAAERKLAGTPQSGDTGTLSVKVTASDGMGGSVSDTFDIVVSAAAVSDTAPAFAGGASIPTQTWTVDAQITAFTLPAATGGNGAISYALTPALPAGVTLDATTRQVSGTPTAAAAEATYTWRASDGDSNAADTDSDTLTFMLTVNKATLAAPTGLALKADSKTRTGFTVTWTAVTNAAGYTATATPSGGTAVAGTVDTSGTKPEASFTGLTEDTVYKVAVTATGDVNYADSEASDEFDARTVANRAPTVANAIPDKTATVGKHFLYTLPANTFSDADGDSLTYTAMRVGRVLLVLDPPDTALPLWLFFVPDTRTFTGTPRVNNTGTLKMRVTASDGMGGSASDTFDIVVSPAPALDLSVYALTVNEGATGTYTVKLAAKPTADVTVTMAGSGDVSVDTSTDTGDQNTLTFTSTTWNTAQTVTVSAAQDDDAGDDTATIGHTAAGGGYDSVTGSVRVTVDDDDTRGVTLSATALTVKEGESGIYTVVLDSEPTEDVTVTVGGATGDVSVDTSTDTGDQNTLTFTTTNWDTAQTVTVKAADDDDAVADTAVALTHAASGGDYASLTGPSVSVTITENDTRGVTLSATALTVKEGESGTYTVVLDSEPTGDVTVTVNGAAGDVSVDTSTDTGDQNTLTFTSTTWDTAQTVTVSAATDEDAAKDAVVTLTHAVTGADYASQTAGSVSVTITEKDTATFSVAGPATVAEGAGKATYTVTLSAQPGSDVTVKYATSDGTATAGSDYTAKSGTLTFTTTNWDTAQTVDVAITDDTVDDDDETFTFTLSAPGTGSALSASPSVTTTITDDDDPEVTVSFGAATYSVTEGSMVNVTVTLNAAPERSVTILLTTTHGAGATSGDYSGVPASVTFASNETSKTVAIAATDDSVDETDETVTLGFGTLPTRVTAGTIGAVGGDHHRERHARRDAVRDGPDGDGGRVGHLYGGAGFGADGGCDGDGGRRHGRRVGGHEHGHGRSEHPDLHDDELGHGADGDGGGGRRRRCGGGHGGDAHPCGVRRGLCVADGAIGVGDHHRERHPRRDPVQDGPDGEGGRDGHLHGGAGFGADGGCDGDGGRRRPATCRWTRARTRAIRTP